MAMDALVRPLLDLPLFRGLKPLQLTEIVRRAERIIYGPGDVIVCENQVGDAAVVIISGHCQRMDDRGDKNRAEILPEGSLIAELAMLVEVVHVSTIIATSKVKALRLTRSQMHELMENEPAIAEHFSTMIIGRLQALAEELRVVDSTFARAAEIMPMLPPVEAKTCVHAAL